MAPTTPAARPIPKGMLPYRLCEKIAEGGLTSFVRSQRPSQMLPAQATVSSMMLDPASVPTPMLICMTPRLTLKDIDLPNITVEQSSCSSAHPMWISTSLDEQPWWMDAMCFSLDKHFLTCCKQHCRCLVVGGCSQDLHCPPCSWSDAVFTLMVNNNSLISMLRAIRFSPGLCCTIHAEALVPQC